MKVDFFLSTNECLYIQILCICTVRYLLKEFDFCSFVYFSPCDIIFSLWYCFYFLDPIKSFWILIHLNYWFLWKVQEQRSSLLVEVRGQTFAVISNQNKIQNKMLGAIKIQESSSDLPPFLYFFFLSSPLVVLYFHFICSICYSLEFD